VLEGQADFDWRDRLDVLQPVLVAVEIALAELWASWGIRPDRVVGQSMGEIAAAYVAGCLDLETMARLACQRGLVVARASGKGAMGVVALSTQELSRELEDWGGRVEVAGISSPSTTIVAGDRDAVKGLVASLEARGVFARPLEVDFASHCFHMDPLLEDFRQRIGGLSPRKGSIPFVSTVDGEERVGSELDADYWVRNLRAAVSLPPAVEACLDAKASVFLEVSPHPSLSRAIEEIAGARDLPICCLGSLQREQDEQRSLLGSLADLHVAGVTVDFAALHPDGRLVETPLYALQRRRYWFGDRNRSHSFRPTHPLLGPRRASSVDARQSFWDVLLDLDAAPYLDDHRVEGRRVLPASLYLELALAVCAEIWPDAPCALEEVELRAPLQLPRDARVALQLVLTREDEGVGSLRISSRDAAGEGGWTLRARARLGPAAMREGERPIDPLEHESLEPLPSADLVARLESQGISLGRRFQTFKELGLEGSENDAPSLLAHLMLPRVSESEWHAYLAHPALVEGALQLLGETREPARALRGVSIDSIRLDSALGSECWVRVRAQQPLSEHGSTDEVVIGDVDFFDREGRVLGRIDGLRGRSLASARAAQWARGGELHRIEWRPIEVESAADARPIRRWILIADAESEAQSLAVELEKRSGRCFFCEKVEDLAELAARLRRDSSEPWGLVLQGWADRSDPERQEPESHRSFRIASWSEAIRAHCADAAEVWIASRGLQRVLESDPLPGAGAAALAADVDGFASLSELGQCRFFDVSASLEHRERVRLAEVMGAGLSERQLAARDETLFGVRLRPAPEPGEGVSRGRCRRPAGEGLFRAELEVNEGVGEIIFRESPAAGLLPEDAVEVEVRAASLSALDVMSSLGLSRGETGGASGLGRDFAGIVTDCGPGVVGVRVGDRVMGLAEGAVARRVVVPSAQLALLPPGLDFVEGASLPLPYAVAALALEELSVVRPGQRVLIRSAAGGVGLAAISIARSQGAEVFATAGDESRRALLRQWGAVVLDAPSRGGVDAATRAPAEGFDLIVAAESEALLHDSLESLRPGGRYLDLSPRREFELGEVGSLRLDANRAYSALDLRAFVDSDPGRIKDVLRRTAEAVRAGERRALPATVFPVSEAGRALRFIAQNRHTGRVTLDFAEAERLEIVPLDEVPTLSEKEGTWVVAGAPGPMREPIVEWLRRRGGVDVRRVALTDLGAAIAELASEGRPLRGLVYVDSVENPLGEVLPRAIARLADHAPDLVALISLRKAVDGAQTAPREWETRTWLDRLLVATLEGRAPYAFGLAVPDDVTPTQLHRMLDEALASGGDAAIQVSIGAAERAARRASSDTPLFDELEVEGEGPRRTGRLREELSVLGGGERRRGMDRFVGDALATVLSLGEREREALDLARPLDQLGLDSLMMMELFMGISRELELEIARDWFPAVPSAADVSAVLLEQLEQTARHAGA
jgi:acyl transferase domain-containing protein/acyl carrier protein